MKKNGNSGDVTGVQAKERKAYNGIQPKADEQLVPMLVDDAFLEVNNVKPECVRSWSFAGVPYKVVFYAVPKAGVATAMSQYYSEVNDLLDQVLGPNRDSRCMIPQEDGSLKVCPKKNGDNREACRDCPHNGVYERQDKSRASVEELRDNYELEIADPHNMEEEVILDITLEELLVKLKEINPRYHKIVTMGLGGYIRKEIIAELGLEKSRAYQEFNNAKKEYEKLMQ